MDRATLYEAACDFVRHSPLNCVPIDKALAPDVVGMRMYDVPLMAVARADDALFASYRAPEAIGPHYRLPADWLPQAQSVVSFFFPFTRRVREANRKDLSAPCVEWLHARIDGQQFLNALLAHLAQWVQAAGIACVAPSLSEGFHVGVPGNRFTSNWSERHAAYACGLGTFGLSKSLITQKGTAGRFGSLVLAAALPPDARDYTGLYDYCTRCGACVRNCPAHAITLQSGKSHAICAPFVSQTGNLFPSYYGCGKCQVAVPCESQRPPNCTRA